MFVEEHEEAIETWFKGDQKKTLTDYLCAERVLTREQSGNVIMTKHPLTRLEDEIKQNIQKYS